MKNPKEPAGIYLESPRLILRKLGQADAKNLVELDADPEVTRYISDGKSSSLDDVLATLVRVKTYYEKFNGQLGVWAAEQKLSKNFVGWFHLRPDKNNLENVTNLEIGYRLGASFWGKGFATEMGLLLVQKAFRELNAETVFATAMESNAASINVLIKLGLTFQSKFIETRFPGENKSAVKYVLRREDWVKTQSFKQPEQELPQRSVPHRTED